MKFYIITNEPIYAHMYMMIPLSRVIINCAQVKSGETNLWLNLKYGSAEASLTIRGSNSASANLLVAFECAQSR